MILHALKSLTWQTGGKRQNTILKFKLFSVFKYICSGNPKWRPPELLGFAKSWIHNVHLTAGCRRWRNSFCRQASFSDWCICDITDAVGRRSLWRIMGTDEQGSVRGRYGELYSFTKWARCGVSNMAADKTWTLWRHFQLLLDFECWISHWSVMSVRFKGHNSVI